MYEAIITPHFREFLPPWIARQPWYAGSGVPSPRLAGTIRLQDPAGQVGIETHLLADGGIIYQIPMTYRGAPLAGQDGALIATAEHGVLGTRWIYDAEADPVWQAELLRLVETEETSDAAASLGATARGKLLTGGDLTAAAIRLVRVLSSDPYRLPPEALGLVLGDWTGPDGAPAEGCLAVITPA